MNEDDIYVKPVQKFYSMIIKSLNKEPNYNFKINNKKTTLICTISYSTEMVDIDEHIKFTKLEDHKTKELLLIDEIRSLKEQVTNLNDQVKKNEFNICKMVSYVNMLFGSKIVKINNDGYIHN